MAELTAKQTNYISRVIAASNRLVEAHDDMAALLEEYNALDYGNSLQPGAFAGDNSHIAVEDIIAVMVTHAAIEAVFDAGHRTNLLTMRG